MKIVVQCDVDKHKCYTERVLNSVRGQEIRFLGCPARIREFELLCEGTVIQMIIDVDAAFDAYLAMHALYLNVKDDREMEDDIEI